MILVHSFINLIKSKSFTEDRAKITYNLERERVPCKTNKVTSTTHDAQQISMAEMHIMVCHVPLP
jgi:hypothetical protein